MIDWLVLKKLVLMFSVLSSSYYELATSYNRGAQRGKKFIDFSFSTFSLLCLPLGERLVHYL